MLRRGLGLALAFSGAGCAGAGSSGPQATGSGTEGNTTGTGSTAGTESTSSSATTANTTSTTGGESVLRVHLIFVHGVKNCDDDRLAAQDSLKDLEKEILSDAAGFLPAFAAAHPGSTVSFTTSRPNLYAHPGSGMLPEGVTNPLTMDDWTAGASSCGSSEQGDPCTTAFEWRNRLAASIKTDTPADTDVLIVIGHSTGARTAFEIAADSQIDAVVSVQGMIDAIGGNTYNMVGPFGFETACKNGDAIGSIGGSCIPGNGWCEYAARLDGRPAADALATNRDLLTLTSAGACSSIWLGQSDGSLPIEAQGHLMAPGVQTSPLPQSKALRFAHGSRYGAFCHSAIDSPGNADHEAAVTAASVRILSWMFEDAPTVVGSEELAVEPGLTMGESSDPLAFGTSCNGAAPASPPTQVAGICHHPGAFDGDSHPIANTELQVVDGPDCTASVVWTQSHSASSHTATLHGKTLAVRSSAGLLGRFVP